MNADSVQWCVDNVVAPMVGQKIVGAIISDDEAEYGFILEDEKGARSHVWVLSDEEGNDAGYLSVEKP